MSKYYDFTNNIVNFIVEKVKVCRLGLNPTYKIQAAYLYLKIFILEIKKICISSKKKLIQININLINSYYLISNTKKVIKLFENLSKENKAEITKDFELLKKIIISYFINNRYNQVIDIINEILIIGDFTSNINYTFLYQYLIYSLYSVGENDKAKEILCKFILLLPKDEKLNKLIINSLYFKISIQIKQYNEAYKYLFLIASKKDYISLSYFYSQLSLLFNLSKENALSRKAYNIFSLMKNKSQLSYREYINIANSNAIIALQTRQNKFYEFSIFFYKKSLKKVNKKNKNEIFTTLIKIILNYIELNEINKATHYLWLIIKNSESIDELKEYYKLLLKHKIFSNENNELFITYKKLLIYGINKHKKCNPNQYIWIADNIADLSRETKSSEISEIAICFYKKALKKTHNKKQIFDICMKIQSNFFELKKYNQSNIYVKLAIKNTKEKDDLVYCKEIMAINYYLLKQHEKSLKYYKELLSNTDKIPASKIYSALALNYFELKNIKKALKHIETAYSIKPNDVEINEIYKKIIEQV